jgi:hypothetical protein
MAKMHRAQDDFDSLGIAHHIPMEDSSPVEDPVPSFSQGKQSCSGDEKYIPVNFIPDSVHEMINAWQEAHTMHLGTYEMDMLVDSPPAAEVTHNQDIYEPVRSIAVSSVTVATAPKRFYRTFWRSAARRIIQREKENIYALSRSLPA